MQLYKINISQKSKLAHGVNIQYDMKPCYTGSPAGYQDFRGFGKISGIEGDEKVIKMENIIKEAFDELNSNRYEYATYHLFLHEIPGVSARETIDRGEYLQDEAEKLRGIIKKTDQERIKYLEDRAVYIKPAHR